MMLQTEKDRKTMTNLHYRKPAEMPSTLRFCLRFLGLWTGCKEFDQERRSNAAVTEEILMQDVASDDRDHERDALILRSTRSTKAAGM